MCERQTLHLLASLGFTLDLDSVDTLQMLGIYWETDDSRIPDTRRQIQD